MPLTRTEPDPLAGFITTHTRARVVAHVPEITLHLADDAIALWETTERARGETDLPPPFWAFAWAGGQALARYILDHPDTVTGRRVLDLAAGSGIVAIAAGIAGAFDVTACEIDPYAVAAIARNADLNQIPVHAALADVLASPNSAHPGHDAEIVLAGDVFYSRTMADQMLAYLRRAHERGARVLVGDPGRAYLPQQDFVEVARYEVPVVRALEDADTKTTRILRPAW